MIEELNSIRNRVGFQLVVIDVDADPVLEELYGEWVPVLMHESRELARYRLDVPAVENYLHSISGGPV